MEFQLRSALFLAQDALRRHLKEGCITADCTAGNGHDTCFLAALCGDTGRVYAFDIQESAVASTAALLEKEGLAGRVVLIRDGHENILRHGLPPLDAVMFNLGWLPGGDKNVTTRRDTTLTGIMNALALLKSGGIATVCVYPGHEEGAAERDLLAERFALLRPQEYNALRCVFANAGPGAPECWIVQKQ